MFSINTTPAVAGALMLAGACALVAHSPLRAQDLRIVEVWSTRGPADAPFGSINGMVEAGNGRVWVSDEVASRIVAIVGAGRSFARIARSGNGPGEVRTPSLLAKTPDRGQALYDVGHSAVLVFDSTGSFQRRVQLALRVVNPKGFVVRGNGHIVVSGGAPGRREAIHEFDGNGLAVVSWHPVPDDPDPMAAILSAGGPLAISVDGNLLFSRAAPHQIMAFDRRTRQGAVIAQDRQLLQPIAGNFARAANDRTSFNWWFPQSKGLLVLSDGSLLNVVRFRSDGYSVWELYSPDGSRIGLQRIDRAYAPWSITSDGLILASYEDAATGEHVATGLRLTVVGR